MYGSPLLYSSYYTYYSDRDKYSFIRHTRKKHVMIEDDSLVIVYVPFGNFYIIIKFSWNGTGCESFLLVANVFQCRNWMNEYVQPSIIPSTAYGNMTYIYGGLKRKVNSKLINKSSKFLTI